MESSTRRLIACYEVLRQRPLDKDLPIPVPGGSRVRCSTGIGPFRINTSLVNRTSTRSLPGSPPSPSTPCLTSPTQHHPARRMLWLLRCGDFVVQLPPADINGVGASHRSQRASPRLPEWSTRGSAIIKCLLCHNREYREVNQCSRVPRRLFSQFQHPRLATESLTATFHVAGSNCRHQATPCARSDGDWN